MRYPLPINMKGTLLGEASHEFLVLYNRNIIGPVIPNDCDYAHAKTPAGIWITKEPSSSSQKKELNSQDSWHKKEHI